MPIPIDRTSGSFILRVASTGVPVSLGSPFPGGLWNANRVDIQALVGNSAPIMVGDYQVAADQSNGGVLLNVLPASSPNPAQPDAYLIELITSLQGIFINGQAGDGVSVNWWRGDRN